MKTLTLAAFTGLLAISVAGCEGRASLSQGQDGPNNLPTNNAENNATPNNTVVDPNNDTTVTGPLICPSCLPMARLTREEYQRTLVAVFDDPLTEIRFDYLPTDFRVGPFKNNASEDTRPDQVEAYRDVAEAVAQALVERGATVLGCNPTEASCAMESFDRFAPLVLRRPVTDEQRAVYAALPGALPAETPFEDITRITLAALLQSPGFLYRLEIGTPTDDEKRLALDGYEMASRLSFFLWKQAPDQALLDLAGSGVLDTTEGVRAQAEQMLDDPRADAAIARFHAEWLGIADLEQMNSDDAAFLALQSDMMDETAQFTVEIFRSAEPTLETLLTNNTSTVTPELAAYYGLTQDAQGQVTQTSANRSGLLTQASFLATHSSDPESTAIYRGLAVIERFLCQPRRPPPAITEIVEPDQTASFRTQLEQKTSPAACQACHRSMNPPGFAFGYFDEVGLERTDDNGHPIDASGDLLGVTSMPTFTGVPELAEQLFQLEATHRCMTIQWLRYALGHPISEADGPSMEAVYTEYETSGWNLRELVLSIVETDSFRFRHLP